LPWHVNWRIYAAKEHDPEKCEAVFRNRSCSNNELISEEGIWR
jgi:hypothetical protein